MNFLFDHTRKRVVQFRFSHIKKIFLYAFIIASVFYVFFLMLYWRSSARNRSFVEKLPHSESVDQVEHNIEHGYVERKEDVSSDVMRKPTERYLDTTTINDSDDESNWRTNEKVSYTDKSDFRPSKTIDEKRVREQEDGEIVLPTQSLHSETPHEYDEEHKRKEEKSIFQTAPWEFSILEGVQNCRPEETPLQVFINYPTYHNSVIFAKQEYKSMGELRYWKDIFTGITLLCTNVTFASNDLLMHRLFDMEYDVILTDMYSLSLLRKSAGYEEIKCKMRMVDVWGTPEKQNHEGLQSKQYLVPFEFQIGEDNFQNEYIGMILSDPPDAEVVEKKKKNQGLLWGKSKEYYKGRHELVERVSEIVPLIATAEPQVKFKNGSDVQNLGIVSQEKRNELLRESKFIIGFGNPVLGLTPFEALIYGCVVLLPKFDPPRVILNNPTIPLISQHPEASEIGQPYVYDVDLDDIESILEIVEMIVESEYLKEGYRPENYSVDKVVERLRKNLWIDFCTE